MKVHPLITSLLLTTAATWSMADDSMKPSSKDFRDKEKRPVMKENVSLRGEAPVDRQVELRLGPRLSFLSGDVRLGVNGTQFDIWDNLGLDSPSAGIQADGDWQPMDRWHVTGGVTWDHYDHSGITNIAIGNGAAGGGPLGALTAGSFVAADLELYTFEASIGYDVIKTNTFRLKPYIGGKGYLVDGKFQSTNNGAGGNGAVRSVTDTQGEATYLLGIDGRVYISPRWYMGGDIGGSAWPTWYNLTGDLYLGYDFSQAFGLRLGYAYDYVDYENDGKSVSAQPLLGAVYLQAVWGF